MLCRTKKSQIQLQQPKYKDFAHFIQQLNQLIKKEIEYKLLISIIMGIDESVLYNKRSIYNYQLLPNYNRMAWIFGQCKDQFGGCIRQYCIFAATFVTFLMCVYSIAMTMRKRRNYNFQIIPLIVNGAATLALLSTLSQFQQQNIYIIMLVIEIYSYSLLTYSYAGLYLLGTKKISKQQFKKVRMGFIIFSIFILLGILGLIIFQIFIKLQCKQSHGIGNLALTLVQAPLYAIALAFVSKTKNHIKKIQDTTHENDGVQINLISSEDQYIKIRYQQANLMILSFTISIAMHIITVIMFFTHDTSCSQGKYISTQDEYQVIMFTMYDFTTLLPHLTMPIILYFIPACHDHSSSSHVVNITPNYIQKSAVDQNFIFSSYGSQQKIRNMAKRNTLNQNNHNKNFS